MSRGCLWQLLLAGIILFLFIFFYFRYFEPRIKRTTEVLKRMEEVTGERRKRRRKKIKELKRWETPRETTGIPEIDEYQKMLESARRKLRGLRRMMTPR